VNPVGANEEEDMRRAEKGNVYLVGSGPGNPELLTVRAVQLLETADVVFHDELVSDEVLELVHRSALVTNVGKRCGQPKITQVGINALMIESARAGQSVVRLKSGDPLVFGRAGEEIAALRGAGISFEVVPGVTAALAAGAVLGLPLTDRKSASKLIFCTGHHAADKAEGTPIWSGPLPEDATLVVYMPGRHPGRIARELMAAGVKTNTPCCAVSHVATARQSYTACRLVDFAKLVCGPAPLLLLIGRAMESLVGEDDVQAPEGVLTVLPHRT
jgi:uroporphyrin-III C-methyltransferase